MRLLHHLYFRITLLHCINNLLYLTPVVLNSRPHHLSLLLHNTLHPITSPYCYITFSPHHLSPIVTQHSTLYLHVCPMPHPGIPTPSVKWSFSKCADNSCVKNSNRIYKDIYKTTVRNMWVCVCMCYIAIILIYNVLLTNTVVYNKIVNIFDGK